MTVASSTNSVDYTGNGSTTVFSFSFRIFADTDLVVTEADADGVETVLELNTDYTVTGVGSYSGGSITMATAPTSGYAINIRRVLPLTQDTDLRNQGQFFAETHEDVFDRLAMVTQQLQEQIDRSAKLPVTNSADADALVADIVLLADNLSDLNTIADAISDIQTVADDLNEATSEIEVVAGAIANVNTVGSNISNVNTVAGISSNVTTVAGIQANVTTVAGISGDVTTVAGISADVAAVENIAANVTTVAGISSNVTTVAGISANVTTVAGISSAVSTVATNIADVQNAEENADAAIAAKDAALVAQAAAESALASTLAAFDSFDDRYLGSKTSDPTLDNDGNALAAGALYFNSVSGIMKVYTGSAWVAAYVTGTAADISFSPTGGIAATTVQAAIAEVDSEKLGSSAIGVSVQAYDANTAKTNVTQSYTAAQRGSVSALTDGATITPDFAVANNFSVTLGGNRTLANPSNLVAGQSGVIKISQDATGSRTLAFGSYWKFSNGTAPTLTTTASAVDVLAYYVDNGTRITARLISDVK